jgi:hypothetical protein
LSDAFSSIVFGSAVRLKSVQREHAFGNARCPDALHIDVQALNKERIGIINQADVTNAIMDLRSRVVTRARGWTLPFRSISREQ